MVKLGQAGLGCGLIKKSLEVQYSKEEVDDEPVTSWEEAEC